MASRPLQPSEYEIQREVEALKDLKRRSTNPAALTIDPDLPIQPIQSPQVSPTSPYRSNRGFTLATDTSPVDAPARSASKSDRSNDVGRNNGNDSLDGLSDDPFHLFWVPASLHPEIAPAEFREFLKEHARSPASDENASLGRSLSVSSSSGLSRKKSMLSRQYRPKETDGDEEENIVPLKRNRSFYRNEGPKLTISDLQRLEELAEEASQSDDPSKLRNVLRRSLSLNISPTAILLDDIPDMEDDADAPIIVPPRDKALKRTARTKIRKVGLPGDGGGHRFASSRKGKKSSQPPPEPRTSSDLSNSDHGELETSSMAARPTLSEDGSSTRPESYSEEQSIFDAYVSQEDEHVFSPTLEAPQRLEPFTLAIDLPPTPSVDAVPLQPQPDSEPALPILHQPKPQHLAVPQPTPEPTSRTPSPNEPAMAPTPIFPSSVSPAFFPPTPTPGPSGPKKDKEKDKKGLFKWGDKSNKKANKERAPEKESGFLSSLFGRKKHDSEYQSSITGGTAGREAAQALLGASKSSKNHIPPGLAPGIGGNPYARYPIHVERAIYRLSHIKLANPRRPLYEQVLISNLMFWYLGIINKAQNPSPPASSNGPTASSTEKQDAEKEEQERQQQEKEQREKAEKERLDKERLEKERLEKEQREREMEMKKKESGRRGSLTKSPPGALPTGGRRAEIPVKGPQYEMQHRVMEQEYGGYNMQQPPRSPTSPSPVNGVPSQMRRPSQPIPNQPLLSQPMSGQPPPGQPVPTLPGPQMGVRPGPSPVQPVSPPARSTTEQYYYPSDGYPPQHPGLPPGAMPPMDKPTWMPMSTPLPQHRTPSPNPQGRSQSFPNPYPPQQPALHKQTSQENLGDRNGKAPMRSLSATASTIVPPSLQQNGDRGHLHGAAAYSKRPRTADSVPQIGEEEDVPLAVWQQRRT